MSVLLATSLGDLVIDLYVEKCPLASKNFLKLCKIKYYNNCLFHSVQKDFIVQTGDPTGTGSGGDSIYKFLYGDQARFFTDEMYPDIKHDKIGVVAMASAGENLNASQFYITTRADLDYLDGKHTVFGIVAEGEDVLMRINEAFVDEKFRPYKNIRIKHTYLIDDPFEDPPELAELIPENSPELRPPAEGEEVRLEDDWVPLDEQLDPEELEKSLRVKEAHSRAVVLEMIGDIPEAEIKPPENVLFVCKLNPVTQEEDLEVIFSRFGKIVSADIIRDYKTGDSLCYAFIEFETQEACEAAYFKMDNVLIDDRRIHVDFSQSVARLWTRYRRFGKTDDGDAVGGAKGKGCFKCGESGHIAKDCPENNENGEMPKYKIKNIDGQHGGSGKRYDMVFDHASIEDDMDRRSSDDRNGNRKREREERYADDRSKEDKLRGHKSSREDRDRGERRGRDREHIEPRDREYRRHKYEDRHERRDREERRLDDKPNRDRDKREREQKHDKDSGRHPRRFDRDDPRRSDRDGRTNEREAREDRHHREPSSRHHYRDERHHHREVSPEKDRSGRKASGEHHPKVPRQTKESEHTRRHYDDSD